MKLKYNNFFIITPVFLLVAIVLATFNFSTKKYELIWGLNEELFSITTATSLFINHKDELSKEELIDIQNSLDNIRSYNRVKRFVLLKDDKVMLTSVSENMMPYNSHIRSSTKYAQSDIYNEGEIFLIDAYMPMKNSALALVVTLDASYVIAKEKESFEQTIIAVAVITLVGAILSIILTLIVTVKIRNLGLMARFLASGKYESEVKLGKVREFSDLGETLNIMKSILQELLFKTRNSIVQEELFDHDNELIKRYSHSNFGKNFIQNEKMEISISHLGKKRETQFFNCIETEKSLILYYGEVKADVDPLKSVIHAKSLSYYLNSVGEKDLIDAQKVVTLFDITTLNILYVDKVSCASNLQNIQDKTVTSKELNCTEDKVVVITQNSLLQERVENYCQKFSFLALDNLSSDLPKLFVEDDIILLIKRLSS